MLHFAGYPQGQVHVYILQIAHSNLLNTVERNLTALSYDSDIGSAILVGTFSLVKDLSKQFYPVDLYICL